MATREIDELEYAELKRVYGVADKISKNDKARALLQEAVSIASPEDAGPETRLRSEFRTELGEIAAQLKADREERAADKAERDAATATRRLERQWSEGRTAARTAGYTDEGLEKLEAFMEAEGIANHKHAIPAFEKLNPPAEPVANGGSAWNLFDMKANEAKGIANLDALMGGDEDSFLAAAVPAAIREVRGG